MRSLSLPDFSELADIQAFDDLFVDAPNAIKQDDDNSSTGTDQSVAFHPMRVFSLGLHRSISMPKQESSRQPKPNQIRTASIPDDFYIPDEDASDDDRSTLTEVQPSFRFYSDQTLRLCIPPSATVSPGTFRPTLIGRSRHDRDDSLSGTATATESRTRSLSLDGVEDSLVDDNDACHERKSLRTEKLKQESAREMSRKEAIIFNLSAFFGAIEPEKTSPKSVSDFPPLEVETRPEQALAKFYSSTTSDLRVDHVHYQEDNFPYQGESPLRSPPSSPSSSPRRSIFGKTAELYSTVTVQQMGDADKEFVPFGSKEFVDSGKLFPTVNGRPVLARKPSLKKVSSVRSMASNKSDSGGIRPSVSFSNLSIREYDVALGDNPSCSYGPPISLGWEYRDMDSVPVDNYESSRSLHNPRRNTRQLLLSYNVRKYLLLKTAGYSKSELREAIQEVDRIKRERQVTDLFLPASKLDEVMEGVIEQVRAMFTKGL